MSDCFNQQHLKAYVNQWLELHNAGQGSGFMQSGLVSGQDRTGQDAGMPRHGTPAF